MATTGASMQQTTGERIYGLGFLELAANDRVPHRDKDRFSSCQSIKQIRVTQCRSRNQACQRGCRLGGAVILR